MANISQITVTAAGTQTFNNFPKYTIEFKITSSEPGDNTVLHDFTGNNAFKFPQDLAGLTEVQRIEIVRMIAEYLIQKRVS